MIMKMNNSKDLLPPTEAAAARLVEAVTATIMRMSKSHQKRAVLMIRKTHAVTLMIVTVIPRRVAMKTTRRAVVMTTRRTAVKTTRRAAVMITKLISTRVVSRTTMVILMILLLQTVVTVPGIQAAQSMQFPLSY